MPSLRLARSRVTAALAAIAVAATTAVVAAAPSPIAHADTEQQLAAVKRQLREASNRLDTLEHKAEAAAERYNAARDELREVRRAVDAAHGGVERERTAVAEKQADVDEFIIAAYQGGGIDTLAAFVSGSSPQDTIDRLDSLGVVARNQEAALAELQTAKVRATQAQAVVDQQLERQRRTTERVEAEKASIAAAVQEQVEFLDDLEDKRSRLRTKLAAEERAAAAELARRREAIRSAAEDLARQDINDDAGYDAPDPDANGSNRGQIAVKWAHSMLGRPYVWGADGPNSFDCSGLTQYVWGKAGVYLPHFTGAQWNMGRHISFGDLQPGDLVFFYPDHHHVGIYIGGGKMIHAPQTGDVVKIAPAWRSNFSGAVRVG